MDVYRSKSLFLTGFAFDILFALALVGFLIWSCLIRNKNGQMKGVVLALVSWLIAQITYIVYKILFIAEAVVTQYYNIDLFLSSFFSYLAELMVVFIFFNLIHRTLNRLTDSGKPYAAISIVHWIVVGILGAISVAAWALFVAYRVKVVQGFYREWEKLAMDLNKVDTARVIVLFVFSVEIFAWLLFAALKAGSHRFASRIPIFAAIGGSICWFAYTLTNTIIYAHYYLDPQSIVPEYVPAAKAILQCIFGVGTLVGILLCCQEWRYIDDSMDKQPNFVQYPYDNAPQQQYVVYQQQQQFQPYPGQPQPQYPQQWQQPAQAYQQQPSPPPAK